MLECHNYLIGDISICHHLVCPDPDNTPHSTRGTNRNGELGLHFFFLLAQHQSQLLWVPERRKRIFISCAVHPLSNHFKRYFVSWNTINKWKGEKNPSLGNLRTEELCALCSSGHAKMQFGGCPALHWKVMVFTELSYDQLFTDSLWHTDRAEHRMLLSKSNDTRSVTEWRNICH